MKGPKKQHGTLYRLTCQTCGKVVGAVIPRGGDGTAYRSRRHRNNAGEPCADTTVYEGDIALIETFRQ